MSTHVIIRQAEADDVVPLSTLDRRAWDASSTPAVLPLPEIPFDQKNSLVDTWLAEMAGQVVGYVTLGWRSALPSNQHVCMIWSIAVEPGARRRGVGKALLVEAERQAAQRRCTLLRLYVLGSNAVAQAAYTRAGFVLSARLEGEFIIQGLPVDDLIMSKRVRSSAGP